MNEEQLLLLLPPILRAVVVALGLARAQEFLAEFGGINVHIPKKYTPRLGLTEAEFVCLRDQLGCHLNSDGRVTLPKVDKILINYRNEKIRQECENNSIAALAKKYDLCSRQIQNICRGHKNSFQLDIFDL